ncbi:unnamed protein product [Ilex paraguariensis]|uniref:Uncharacterized protein n=1 Tax=Ilex paraguariensis TaxID=185542 RepID=A0ABC8RHY1_9AQUA
MDLTAGMVDKAINVLSNLATINEGRALVRREGFLYWLRFRVGFARGKENAVAALLQLCNRFCNMVLQEGVVPLLVALSQSGTPIAKEKARALLAISETKGMVMLGGVDFDEMTFGRAIL